MAEAYNLMDAVTVAADSFNWKNMKDHGVAALKDVIGPRSPLAIGARNYPRLIQVVGNTTTKLFVFKTSYHQGAAIYEEADNGKFKLEIWKD